MKTRFVSLFAVAILIGIGIPVSRAQSPDTLKAPCSDSVFPIGVIRNYGGSSGYPVIDSVVKLLGINCYYKGWDTTSYAALFPREGVPFDTTASIKDPFYYKTDSNITYTHSASKSVNYTHSLLNLLQEAAYGMDVRCYLPGTSGVTEEYSYPWIITKGSIDSTDNSEWVIKKTDAISGDYVLRLTNSTGDTVSPGATAPYSLGSYSSPPLDTNHIGNFTYDFVFFLTSGDLASVSSGTTPLYQLEFWRVNGSSDSVKIDSVVITKNLYNGLAIANTNQAGQNLGAEALDNWKGIPSSTHYKFLRHTIVRDSIYKNGSAIDVRLKTFAQIAIRPRLLRVRNWIGQQVLSGNCDSVLIAAAKALAAAHENGSAHSWSIERENPVSTFHCYAYVHNLLCDNNLPPGNALQNSNMAEFAHVFRDQCEAKNAGKGQNWFEVGWFAIRR